MVEGVESGDGDVYVKKSNERIGRFAYRLETRRRRPDSVIMHTDADISLDPATASRFMREGATLVLRLDDGRCIDFFVTYISGLGDVIQVSTTGGFRTEGCP